MRDWLGDLIERLDLGSSVVTVTCVAVSGSAPCAPGSRMIVDGTGTMGTIGGGNLEFLAIEQARKLLASQSRCLVQSLPLGPMLSQCCGGRVTLVYERFTTGDLAFFKGAAQSDGNILTRCVPDNYGKWLLGGELPATLDGSVVPDPAPDFTSSQFDGIYWQERAQAALPQVCIFGAGHVGQALARVLMVMACDVVVIDPREDFLEQFPAGMIVVRTDDPATMDQWWRQGAIAIVLTHSHQLDYLWISAILRRGDSRYCGLIGSNTKRTRFIRRLRLDGLTNFQLDRLTCPIGMPGLNSKDPGAVAVSTAAQIIPFLADLSCAGAGQNCECTLPGNHNHVDSLYEH